MKVSSVAFILGVTSCLEAGIITTVAQAANQLRPVPIQAVKIKDSFWSPKRAVWQAVTIPDCFTKFENDRGGALNNFDRVRDGKSDGHAGPPWYDGLIYEMIRGSADFLAARPDPVLESRIDAYIARIAAAQTRDTNGYLNTWTELQHPNQRWGLNGGNDGYQHEMYNVGALCEAAVHYCQATGKNNLLNVAVKLANYTCYQIGPAPKYELVPNHAIVEEAFANLYLFFREHPGLKRDLAVPVDESRYLALAQYWVEARGHPRKDQLSYGSYNQDHEPVFEQTTIEGHAVRAALLCSGVTALAGINGRDDYRQAALRLWGNMCGKKMYVTGGIGATAAGEAFGKDYFLPNNGYLETCGAVAAAFFDQNLDLLAGDARYADALERELYNGALAGVSLAGDSYTYVNPLEAPHGNARWAWNGCPCCPPMFLKLMGAMPGYIYAQDNSGIYVNLFVGSEAQIQFGGGKVVLKQATDYPWQGEVKISVEPDKPSEFDVRIRVPGWCQGPSYPEELYHPENRPTRGAVRLSVNGKPVEEAAIVRGYVTVHRRWRAGDTVQLHLDMPVQRVTANFQVEAARGRVALMRGPMVYCFEGADNGAAVQNLVLPPGTEFTAKYERNLLGGVTVLTATATAVFRTAAKNIVATPFQVTAVPYYANANRGSCPMQVWMPEQSDVATPQSQE
ncbi:MAG TPA: beta-L-arabinofuranosidase domain-containing protein [Verrucomicrobiae bacterium]|nr:beta-L-arabinofuranosidase domain-containing protein [Verrucomicrobiae bacterium]